MLRSVLNSQGETGGRQDILSQEGKCLLVPVMQENLESPVLRPESGQAGEVLIKGGSTRVPQEAGKARTSRRQQYPSGWGLKAGGDLRPAARSFIPWPVWVRVHTRIMPGPGL